MVLLGSLLRRLVACILPFVAAPALAGDGAPAASRLAKELAPEIKSVVTSDKLKMGLFATEGTYLATTTDGREIGLFFLEATYDAKTAPYFAIDLVDEAANVVLDPAGATFKVVRTPKDWLWSTYGAETKSSRRASAPAGNAPRTMAEVTPGKAYAFDTGFVAERSMVKNGRNVLVLWIDSDGRVRSAALGVNHAKTEAEAARLLDAMRGMLALPR